MTTVELQRADKDEKKEQQEKKGWFW